MIWELGKPYNFITLIRNLDQRFSLLREQPKQYFKYTDQVEYVFKGSFPDVVRSALEEIGVTVKVIP